MTGTRLAITIPGDWTGALCTQTDPEVFFPDKGESSHPAIAICRECPVRAQCLDHALDHHEMGVWGGTTEQQRRQIRKQRSAA